MGLRARLVAVGRIVNGGVGIRTGNRYADRVGLVQTCFGKHRLGRYANTDFRVVFFAFCLVLKENARGERVGNDPAAGDARRKRARVKGVYQRTGSVVEHDCFSGRRNAERRGLGRLARRVRGAFHNAIAARRDGESRKRVLSRFVGIVADRPACQIDVFGTSVIELDPVVFGRFHFLNGGHFADKNALIVETADLIGCFKSMRVFGPRRWRSIIPYIPAVVQPHGNILPRNPRKRHVLRPHTVERGQKDVVLLIGEAE
ncbi:hypothetical protein SDC9_85439 [bioreactor metagenome]|uniref:Uncharacterized protein n=1 Tax=bioreactor metagenome TaxID=1076179 RepID=A0A644ZDI1_9ZZZZ